MSSSGDFHAGFVFVVMDRTRKANLDEVRDRLLTARGVRIVHELLGSFDLICYVEAPDSRSFVDTLDYEIGMLKDEKLIAHTETMVILAQSNISRTFNASRLAAVSAWILIDTSVGRQDRVVEQLLAIPGVVNAHPVLGRCDIVAYVEATSMHALQQILDEQIYAIPQITFPDSRLVLMNIPSRE